MRSWLSKNRHVYWLLGLIALALAYFVTQHLGLRYHVVHLPLDDRIPFCPVFVVFYILWYFYVPGCMLWACLRAKDVFCRQAAALFSGALLCVAVFVLYPTCIDFRPAAEGTGVFLALCRLIYAHDAPVNVFPSLHCYEALVLHLVTFRTPPLRARKALAAGVLRAGAFDLPVHAVYQAAFRGGSHRRLYTCRGRVFADNVSVFQEEVSP